jgi:hypothetical protein
VRFMEIPCSTLRRKNTGAMSIPLVSPVTCLTPYCCQERAWDSFNSSKIVVGSYTNKQEGFDYGLFTSHKFHWHLTSINNTGSRCVVVIAKGTEQKSVCTNWRNSLVCFSHEGSQTFPMSTGVRSCYDEGKRTAETLAMDYHRGDSVNVCFHLIS